MNLTDLAQYGIAIVLIAYMAWRDKIFNKTIQNHFAHSEKAFDRLMDVIDKNSSALARNSEALGKNTYEKNRK